MVGKVFNGRYRVTERIGIGGMAEVYRAQDTVLGRIVAIKVMLPQYAADAEFTQRFKQEASAAANLQSPYIVNVYDWGHDDDDYYIVMEYLRGSDLKAAINERGAINERKVAQIGSQVCQALSVAHHLDIIHRDIKPQNIMVQPDGNIKVMDFGIARAKNSVKTQTSSVLGTAHYISPEQAQGKELTAASDIYSLGVVMYEAVTGQLPFDGPDAVSVALKQVNEEPVPPRQVNPNVSPQLESIIMKALEKDPLRRFSTAREMRMVLNDFLAGRLSNYSAAANAPTAMLGATIPAVAAAGAATKVMPPVNVANGKSTTGPQTKVKNYTNGNSSNSSSNDGGKKGGSGKTIGIILAVIVAIAVIGAGVLFLNANKDVEVPDVTNKTQIIAEKMLRDANLEVGEVTEAYDDEIEEGKVISTNPAAGNQVKKDTVVDIVLSKGKEEIEVPSLLGMTEENALKLLEEKGFEGENGGKVFSDKYPAGQICKQSPKKTEKLEKGEVVTYYISKGSDKVNLDDIQLYNQPEQTAINNLKNAGLSVAVEYEYSDSVSAGYVVWYGTPDGSNKVKPGTTVTIHVSQGKKPAPKPQPEPEPEDQGDSKTS